MTTDYEAQQSTRKRTIGETRATRHTNVADNHEPGDHARPARLLVTIPVAAEMLAIGRSAIYQLIWEGDLSPIHIGRSVRLPVSQLHDYVRRQTFDEGLLANLPSQ